MLSLLSLVWISCTVSVAVGVLLLLLPALQNSFIAHLYLFGKIRSAKSFKQVKVQGDLFMLPKSIFFHFYAVGMCAVTVVLSLTVYCSCLGGQWPDQVLGVVNLLRFPVKENYADTFSTLLVLILAGIQVTRRFLECMFVSIYSPGGKMSIVIYVVGLWFYSALPVTCLAGTDISTQLDCHDFLQKVRWHHVAGVVLFCCASYYQNKIASIFAKLRQNKSGEVEDTKHHIPHGSLFKYVSGPHYFLEIIIYLSMNVVYAWQNTMMVWLFVFVFTNQLISGYLSHKYYLESFPRYPKNRKACIPFIF